MDESSTLWKTNAEKLYVSFAVIYMEQDTNSKGSGGLLHSYSFAISFPVLAKKVGISACVKAKCSRKK